MAKIAFVQEELRDRFGVMILSAVLKQGGHHCDVFIQEKNDDFISEILDYKPDIIAFSTTTPGIKFGLDLANQLRKVSEAFIIMGGPHPTFYPEVLNNECLDAICIGEGEYALLELADCFDDGKDFTNIKNLWVKKGGKVYKNDLRDFVDVNELPMYDWEIYFEKYPELINVPTKKIFIVRGCPFACTYCFNHVLKKMYAGKGTYVRFLDVNKAIAHIKYLKEKYGMKWLQITGDTLNANRQWFMEFLDKYKKEINVPFLCNVRIDLVDEEMVKKMKESECDRVDYAIENGNEEIRKNILKRYMTNQQIIDGGKLFIKYGIRVHTTNIIGLPHETVKTAMETVKLNRAVKPEMALCFILQPYPRTEINDYAIKHGFLESSYGFSKFGTGFQIDFDGVTDFIPLKLKESKKLVNLLYFFNLLVKYPWLDPLIKNLINLPTNRFFKFIYIFPIVKQDIKYSKLFQRKLKSTYKLIKVLIFG